MGALKPWHLILVVVVLVILFGSKKLPDAARSLGRSMRIFKAETKALSEDGKDATAEKADAQVTSQQPLDGQASAKPFVDPVQRQQ
jgi:sec-independent protein translocase protein TatA